MPEASVLARLASALADRYRIEREFGPSGMATACLAHDLLRSRHRMGMTP